jgi:phosphoribosyl 1,2-cyclic phosphate phosphodiesterase
MARVDFLGTGAAWGHPVLGCGCAACSHALLSQDPRDRRTRTSLRIAFDYGEVVWIDTGPDFRQQFAAIAALRLDAVLLTHSHIDHLNGLDDISPLRVARGGPVPAYASPQTWAAVEQRFGYLIGGVLQRRSALPGVQLLGLEAVVTPFAVEHGPTAPGALGFIFEFEAGGRVQKIVYSGDLYDVPCPDGRLLRPDLLVLECNWFNEPAEMPPSSWHMSFQRGIRFIRALEPAQVVLVHMSHEDHIKPPRRLLGPAPVSHADWQGAVDAIVSRMGLPSVLVGHDGLEVAIP